MTAPRRRSGSDADQRLQRRVRTDPGRRRRRSSRTSAVPPSVQRGVLDRGAVGEPRRSARRPRRREPGPALVAQEVVVVGAISAGDRRGDRHRLGVHDVAGRDALQAGRRRCSARPPRGRRRRASSPARATRCLTRCASRRSAVDAVGHHQRGEALAEVGRELGRLVAVAGDAARRSRAGSARRRAGTRG